jgi:hypothetical protein
MGPSIGRCGSTIAVAVLGGALVSCAPSVVNAQPRPDGPRVSMAGLVGLARPNDETFREVYASGLVPLSAQLDWHLGTSAEVFAGIRYVGQTGEAIGSTAAATARSLTFRMTSVRFGIGWIAPGRRWRLAVSGGGSYNLYRETWKDLDIETEDAAFGVVVQTSVSYRLSRRVSLLARGEFSAIGVDSIDPALRSVSLGSLDVLGGVSLGFY